VSACCAPKLLLKLTPCHRQSHLPNQSVHYRAKPLNKVIISCAFPRYIALINGADFHICRTNLKIVFVLDRMPSTWDSYFEFFSNNSVHIVLCGELGTPWSEDLCKPNMCRRSRLWVWSAILGKIFGRKCFTTISASWAGCCLKAKLYTAIKYSAV
jgi:hypothetical protein